MNKAARQYLGLACAVLGYYLVHEGAHLLYALLTGVFKEIHIMGLGVQIDVYAQRMSDLSLGLFCLVGSVATTLAAYVLVLLAPAIAGLSSKLIKALLYYLTLAMLFADPLYLSVLFGFFGGGDMNGIALLMPQGLARGIYGVLLAVNGLVFWKAVLPRYQKGFSR